MSSCSAAPSSVRPPPANGATARRTASVRAALNKDLEAFAQLYSQRSKHVYAKIEQGIAAAAWLLSLIAAAAVLLAAAGAYHDLAQRRAAARPTSRRVTEAVAAGETERAVPYGERRDEIGALARSIAVFQDAMRQQRGAQPHRHRRRRRRAPVGRSGCRPRSASSAPMSRPRLPSSAASPIRCWRPRRGSPAPPTTPRRGPRARPPPPAKRPPTCATSRPPPTSLPPR